jgi:hypothetical protein
MEARSFRRGANLPKFLTPRAGTAAGEAKKSGSREVAMSQLGGATYKEFAELHSCLQLSNWGRPIQTKCSYLLSTAAPRYGHLVKRLHHVAYNEGARTDRTSRLVGTLGGDVRFEPRPEQNFHRDFRNHQPPRGLVVSFLHFSVLFSSSSLLLLFSRNGSSCHAMATNAFRRLDGSGAIATQSQLP